MIQCSRGVLKTLLNLKKERGRYQLRFDFKVWITLEEYIDDKMDHQNYKKGLILAPFFTNCRSLTRTGWLTCSEKNDIDYLFKCHVEFMFKFLKKLN